MSPVVGPGRRTLVAAGLMVALLTVLVAACGAPESPPPTTPNGSSAGGPAPTPSAPVAAPPGPPAVSSTPPTSTVTEPPAAGPPTAPGVIVVTGIVRRGASPSCWVLYADDGQHFVVADTQNPPANVAVQVRGVPAPDELSYCNAGTVLHVQHIDTR